MKRTPAEIILTALEADRAELHTAMPGRVVAYHADRNTVDVEPQFRHQIDDEAGNPTDEAYPNIPDVPIAWPRGGGVSIAWALAPGDPVLLVFCERDLGVWRAQGSAGPPGDLRMHGLAGAVAFPGGAFAEKEALPSSAIPSSPGRVAIGPAVTLGAAAGSHPIPKGDTLGALLKSILDTVALITVTCTTPGNPSSPPINAAAITALKAQVDACMSDTHKVDR